MYTLLPVKWNKIPEMLKKKPTLISSCIASMERAKKTHTNTFEKKVANGNDSI